MNWVAYLKYLQVVLKEFISVTATNKNILIWCFRDNFCSFIKAQLDKHKKNLDIWDKVIKKTINAKAKAS